MSTPARTPTPGRPGPVWPARPVPPTVPASSARPAPAPAWPTPPPSEVRGSVAARPTVDVPTVVRAPVVPAPDASTDLRAVARDSPDAARDPSLWWTLGGIVAAVAVTFVTDAVVGTLVLVALLLVHAAVRAFGRPARRTAVAVRSRALDVTRLVGAAATLAVLASVLPTG